MNLYRKFYRFEKENNLSDFFWDDLWIYPLLKVPLFFRYFSAGSGRISKSNKSQEMKRFIKAFITRSGKIPIPDKKLKILFADHARSRKRNQDGSYRNVYFKEIQASISADEHLLFEYPDDQFGHHPHPEGEAVYYPDWHIQKIFLKAKTTKRRPQIDYDIIRAFYAYFELPYEEAFIVDRLNKFKLFVAYFSQILAKLNPDSILLIDSYDYPQMALCKAASDLGIRTIELQHGIIYKSHLAYMYQSVMNRDLFPDSLFTFGPHFTNLVKQESVMFKPNQIVSVGSINLESKKGRKPTLPQALLHLPSQSFVIYITSQWVIQKQLRSFTIELSKKVNEKTIIIYKVHPGEKDASVFYKEFEDSQNIVLIDDKSVDSVELMKIAHIHSTVFSTSFFESSVFNLPNIFIEVEGYSEHIREFVNGKNTFLVKTVKEYIKILHKIIEHYKEIKNNDDIQKHNFYSNNALENILSQLPS